MIPDSDDDILAQRARAGNSTALEELIERSRMRLFQQAYADLRHYQDAQDAVASTCLQVCLNIRKLKEPAQVHSWMQTILRNECRRLRRAVQDVPFDPDGVQAPRKPLVLRLDVQRALLRLPESQARALALFYLEGQSIAEISRLMDRPQGTVKYWLHAGRKQLAHQMEGYAPMTVQSDAIPEALLVVSQLAGETQQTVLNALREAHYVPRLLRESEEQDLAAELQDGRWNLLESWLRRYGLIVLDEQIAGRSVFELLVSLDAARAAVQNPIPERALPRPPICVLAARLFAYAGALAACPPILCLEMNNAGTRGAPEDLPRIFSRM